ncbi:HTH domain-containing protein [Lysobacter capsici]|uniref:HTH domain-containing protein n=1 Tax=Lysobacter capsici TaxID=435897 RepID=UPI00398D617B
MLAQRRDDFSRSQSLYHLDRLIEGLRDREQWEEHAEYVHLQFHRTGTTESAERYVHAMQRAGRWADLSAFLSAYPDFVATSPGIAEASLRVNLLSANWQAVKDLVASGAIDPQEIDHAKAQAAALSLQWHEYNSLIDRAIADPDRRTSPHLLQLAGMAACIERNSDSRQLAILAAKADPENATVLMQAYMLAVQGMWEDDAQVGNWFSTAVALSDVSGGPVQRKSIDDVLELGPAWRKQSESAWASLQAQEIWLGAYAKMINRPIAQLTVGAALTNKLVGDVRRRDIIPAFSGVRNATPLSNAVHLALDGTALLTLAHLGLLDRLPAVVGKLYVAHDTGPWLFDQIQHATFHQPRHIKDAIGFLKLIAQQGIGVLQSPEEQDRALASQVGTELAELIVHANDMCQRGVVAYVIRISPVPVMSTRLQKNADMTEHASVLRSLRSVLDSLEGDGRLSPSEVGRAKSFVQRVDQGWSGDEHIEPGATLLLDDLSVNYLQHTSLLQKLAAAGYTLLVHEQLRDQAQRYASLEESGQQLMAVLRSIREFLSIGVRDGSVEVLAMPRSQWGTPHEDASALQLLDSEGRYDAVVFDDRYFNRYATIGSAEDTLLAIYSSLDVIDHLLKEDAITLDEWKAYRAELRRGGYALVPVAFCEIVSAVDATKLRDGCLVESADLRAIRENVALLQMRGLLRLPEESPWFEQFSESVKELIGHVLDLPEDARKAEIIAWTRQVTDIGLLGESLPGEMSGARVHQLTLPFYVRLCTHLMLTEVAHDSHSVASDLVEELEWRDPQSFMWLVQHLRDVVRSLQVKLSEGLAAAEDQQFAHALLSVYLNRLPPCLREAIIETALASRLTLPFEQVVKISLPNDPAFSWIELWNAAARVSVDGLRVDLTDNLGNLWGVVPHEGGGVALEASEGRHRREISLPDLALASQDPEARQAHFSDMCKRYGLDESDLQDVRDFVRAKRASASDTEWIRKRLECFPLPQQDRLKQMISSGEAPIRKLFPPDMAYFNNLMGGAERPATLKEFSDGLSPKPFTVQSALVSLLLSGHSSTAPTDMVATANAADLNELLETGCKHLDIWSTTGLLEALLKRPDALTTFNGYIEGLLGSFYEGLGQTRIAMTSSLFMAADIRIRALDFDGACPIYWRRLAAVAHAALLERTLLESAAELPRLVTWLSNQSEAYYWAGAVDMRQEPRWNPSDGAPSQLCQELIGRVLLAWKNHFFAMGQQPPVTGPVLIAQLERQRNRLRSIMPGPAEGSVELPEMPAHIIEQALDANDSSADRWRTLILLGHLWQLPLAERASLLATVEQSGIDVVAGVDANDRAELLVGLGALAAASRDPELANAVMQLARAVVDKPGMTHAVCFYVSLNCAAAYADESTWREAVIQATYQAARSCVEPADAQRCITGVEGIQLADWRLATRIARAKSMLRTVAYQAGA